MRRAQRATSTISTLQLLLAGIVLLAVVVAFAVLLAPRKPPAPPASEIKYAERPAERQPPPPTIDYTPPPPPPEITPDLPAATPAPEPDAPPAPTTGHTHRIRGVVRDAATREPLPRIRVEAGLAPTEGLEEIREAWENDRVKQRYQPQGVGEVDDMLAARERVSVMTDEHGAFEFNFPEQHSRPLAYRVETRPRARLATHVDTEPLGPGDAEAVVEILVSTGARIRGRITESGGSTPAPGILVLVEKDENARRIAASAYYEDNAPALRAITDEDGRYEIGGLRPGEFPVLAELANTPYRTGKTLPYRKVLVQSPDQIIENIDFTVDPAGLVWGYVTTPDRQPIQGGDVLLVTSESVFTQAITAALNQAPPIRGRSQEDGYYELTGVPLNQQWRLYATSNDQSPQLADPFILTPHMREARVDIFLFPGTTVQGRVVEPNGTPVPGAQVSCIPSYTKLLSSLDTAQAFRGTTSDDQGFFEIRELPAGSYQIFARKRGYKFSTMGDPVYPDGYTPIQGLQVVLHPIDAGSNSIYGTVTTAAGDPVPGADIRVSGIGAQSFEEATFSATTDGRGAYRIDGVEAGAYGMNVSAQGYAPRRLAGVRLNAPTDIVLIAAGVVRGRVLVRETNQPTAPVPYSVSAVRVTIDGGFDLAGGMGGVNPRDIRYDEDGRFEIFLAEGNYMLEARAAALVPGREQVAIAAGQVTDNVTLYVSEAGGAISGRVVTSDGRSPQGAEVIAVEYTSMSEAMLMLASGALPPDRTQRVGEDGAFAFEGLPAGEYLILARHTGYANGVSETVALEERGNVEGIEVRLGAGGTIEGTVYRNGRAVADALIVVVGEGGTQSVSSDANGFYRVEGLAAGTYQVTVTPIGGMDLITGGIGQVQSTSLEVVEGQVTRHDFGDGSGTQVVGNCAPPPPGGLFALPGFAVLRPPGFPIAEFGEILDRPERLLRLQGQIASINPGVGDFTIEDVFPGEYQLDIFYPVPGQLGAFRYVHLESVLVSGEENVQLDIQVNTF